MEEKPSIPQKIAAKLQELVEQRELKKKEKESQPKVIATIGRAPGNFIQFQDIIEYDTISGNHAEIYVKDRQIYIKDLSTNGTLVNNMLAGEGSKIVEGDIVKMGSLCFKVAIRGQMLIFLGGKPETIIFSCKLPKLEANAVNQPDDLAHEVTQHNSTGIMSVDKLFDQKIRAVESTSRNCVSCGKSRRPGSLFCSSCGKPFPIKAEVDGIVVPVPSIYLTQEGRYRKLPCGACGAEVLRFGEHFCSRCNAPQIWLREGLKTKSGLKKAITNHEQLHDLTGALLISTEMSEALSSSGVQIGANSLENTVGHTNHDNFGFTKSKSKQKFRFVVLDGSGGSGNTDEEIIANMTQARRVLLDDENMAFDPKQAINLANEKLLKDLSNQSYGTVATVDIDRITGGIEIAWKGDAAVVGWNEGNFIRLTKPHNVAEGFHKIGGLDTQFMDVHPSSSYIHSALGGDKRIAEKKSILQKDLPDFLLIMSDGARPNTISATVATDYQRAATFVMQGLEKGELSTQQASKKIIESSRNLAGDTDDITVMIINLREFKKQKFMRARGLWQKIKEKFSGK